MFDLAIKTTLDLKNLKVAAYPSTRLELPHTLFPRACVICFFSRKDLDVISVEIKDSSASCHQEIKVVDFSG
ncbi:hypothetical protein GQ457_08G027090 [Hibiscus cannabinus]